MIETIIILWVAVYALWVLSFIGMGELSRIKYMTISYIALPFIAVFLLATLVAAFVLTPIITIFSSTARSAAKKSLNERR